MQLFLKVLAYWVVFGLPLLLGWRFYKLMHTKNRPRNFYIGSVILYLGIAVWIPYALMRRILGIEVSVMPYLIAHLIGTFTGVKIKRTVPKK